ncbi:ATP-binding protein [Methyloversatilis sp.]|uniref:ATP-binding protein n=1 Tax=Methyloversatilis sp. TaxID=2569862 RepID=UPI0035B1DDEC
MRRSHCQPPIVPALPRTPPSFATHLATVFIVALAAGIDPLLTLSGGQPPVLQLALGAVFAVLLMHGARQALPAMGAMLVVRLLCGASPFSATLDAMLAGMLAGIGSQVLKTFPLQPYPRMRADHYAWFIGVALVLSILFGARAAWVPNAPFYASDWTLHAAAHFAGVLLVVQLVAGWTGSLQPDRILADLRPSLPWMALTLGVTAALFLRVLDGPEPYMLVLPAVLVWSAIRLKVRWMSLLLVAMNAVAFIGTLRGLGPFGSETPLRALLLLQTFVITMSIAAYSLSITLNERAAASRKARTREAQLLDLFDGSIQGILIHRRFQPVYANRRAAELLGFQSVADLMGQRSLAHMVVADDLPVISSDSNRRLLSVGRVLPMQLDVLRCDGQRRTLDSVIRQVSWDGSAAIQATFIDVTDDLRARREQRARLDRQDRQLAAMMRLGVDQALSAGDDAALATLTEVAAEAMDVSRASVWRLDDEGGQLRCLDLYDGHRTAKPCRGHSTGTVLDAALFPAYFVALRSGRTVDAADASADARVADFIESGYLASEGVTAMLDAPVFLDGRLAGVVCLEHTGGRREWAHDEQRFAGELATLLGRFLVARERRSALAEQVRLSAILDATPDYVSTVDTDLRITYLNLSARRTVGVSERTTPGGLMVGDLYPPEAYSHYLKVELPAVLNDGIWVGETRLRCHDGRIMPMSAVRVAHRDADGKVRFVSSVLRDISDIKRNEQALREANETLEQRVAGRTAELAQANERLKDLDRLKSMFIASMSHELRTPLNSIIGFTGVVLAGMAGELNTRQHDQLTRVYGSARHLLALITDVIDISKIEAGFIDVFEERFEVEALIQEAVHSIAPAAREKKLDIEVRVPPGILVQADRRRLLQCVLNFVSNAVKYTVEGRISVEASVHGSWLDISVEDTGIGMDDIGLARLFQPFERLDSYLRVKTPGTGLGLYLTRKIATELMSGSVDVSSTPGVGSRFTLRLPREGSGRAREGVRP